ncbi:MAG: carbamate kinase [bacterium]
MKTAVIALGGNALSPPDSEGDIPEQFEATRKTARILVDLLEKGTLPVITHGNGPQVGEVMRRVEAARGITYSLPLDICVADTMGGMGYMIQQCVTAELLNRGLNHTVSTIISRSMVDSDDPALENPTKPIGPFYSEEEAEEIRNEKDWKLIDDSGRGYRRVVVSPKPLRILEINAIRRLVDNKQIVITCGGGGVPVMREGNELKGVEAVIDKDRASSLLAEQLNVDQFVISTDVDAVHIGYGTPKEQKVKTMSIETARQYLDHGEFPAGSMGPKVEAAADFAEATGTEAIIGGLDNLDQMLKGRSGTRIGPALDTTFYEPQFEPSSQMNP